MAEHRELRRDFSAVLPGARTVVAVAASYNARGDGVPPGDGDGPRGLIARYARGRDYHQAMRARLDLLADFIRRRAGCDVRARACVDSAPLLEREAGMAAGIGFIGKNTMLITPGVGSYTVLGELLVDLALPPDPPERPRCGRCRLCIDVCPTGAIVDEFTIDARRCISYLTIELRGPIPRELRPLVGDMIFGCDLCQEVCPFNTRAPDGTLAELRARPSLDAPALIPLLALAGRRYRRFVEGTALRRVRRGQLLRNVCVALGNSGDARAVLPLAGALRDRDHLVRGHAAWALGRLGGEIAATALGAARETEQDPWVREEIAASLAASGCDPCGPREHNRYRAPSEQPQPREPPSKPRSSASPSDSDSPSLASPPGTHAPATQVVPRAQVSARHGSIGTHDAVDGSQASFAPHVRSPQTSMQPPHSGSQIDPSGHSPPILHIAWAHTPPMQELPAGHTPGTPSGPSPHAAATPSTWKS